MLTGSIGTAGLNQKLQALVELVEALERRVPRPHVHGEEQIAADSADLHAEASEGIRVLRRDSFSDEHAETARAQAVMTDDGGAVPLRDHSLAQDDGEQ